MSEFWSVIHGFFNINGYVFEMLLAVVLFVYSLERRRFFLPRLIVSLAVILAFSVLWTTFVPNNAATQIVKFLVMFALFVTGVCFTFEVSVWGALFCCVGADATQHCAFRVFSIIIALSGLTYESDLAVPINLAAISAVYTAIFFLFARRIKSRRDKYFRNNLLIIISFSLIVFAFGLHCVAENYLGLDNVPLFVIVALFGIICCLLTLGLQYGFSRNDQLVHDMAVMEHLMHIQEEQYRVSKENMDIINVKCHDMKHQISLMRDRIDPTALEELNSAIQIYDASLQTGNEVLDVFLAEKSLLCEKNGVKFDCIVDGECVDFMTPPDIYSLFGNAIDNALEAVSSIAEEKKRVVSLSVRRQMNMAAIHVENYYAGELQFEGDLPKTTKNDNKYHGFGMRSIRMIVEKYKGSLAILARDGVFNLNILLPLPGDKR